MLDKKQSSAEPRRITFNWERIKKQAECKINELKCNSPKISRREELEAIRNQTTRLVKCFEPGTTDTRIDPDTVYDADGNLQSPSSNSINSPSTSINPPPSTITKGHNMNNMTYNRQTYDGTDMKRDGTNHPTLLDRRDGTTPHSLLGTNPPSLLALAPPQGERSNSRRGEITPAADYGPDHNAIALLKQIKNKEITGSELQQDERRLVVRSLRMAGQTQDSISELLGVSRRTIVADCKHLRQMAAMEIQNTDTVEIAGEVYELAKTAIRKALAAGHYKTVSTIMRDMVELLQSMGLIYRAPKTQMNANLNASLSGSRPGYQKYIDTIGEDKNKVVEVLDCMFNAINDSTL